MLLVVGQATICLKKRATDANFGKLFGGLIIIIYTFVKLYEKIV